MFFIMDEQVVRKIVDKNLKEFASGFQTRYVKDYTDPEGVINLKKNNIFISELGMEFVYYSALCRSFDSSRADD